MAEDTRIPQHVAIIMDGNGRWAKKRGLPRPMGHREGCKILEELVESVSDLGVRYLTVYAFSTENWKRTEEEVSAIMALFRFYIKKLLKIAMEKNVRVVIIGDRTKFDEDLASFLDYIEKETAENTKLTFTMGLNYGARDEIRRAVTSLAEDVSAGKLLPRDVTEEKISEKLDTRLLPEPDLLIRTGGEMRLSNFLMWQLAYTELYFTDVLWPDFTMDDFKKAIEAYQGRERRYGGAKA